MRRGGLICLGLGLCCSSLAAQQVLASSAISRLPNSASLPASIAASAAPGAYRPALPVESPALPADFAVSAELPGMATNATLYDVVQSPAPQSFCTQALPPILALQDSDYAFGRLQFNTAAIKGTFRHENLVKMARNFVPGQPLPDAPSYVPLTSREKFDLYLRHTHSVDLGVGAVIDSSDLAGFGCISAVWRRHGRLW